MSKKGKGSGKPSPALNQLNKAQKVKNKEFLKRRDGMLKEVQALSLKYKIDIVGALDYRRDGVWPLVAFVDRKDEYEHAEKKKNIKPILET